MVVSYYNIIDLVILSLIGFGSYYSYTSGYYKKIFEYLKLFIIISISAKLSPYSAQILQKLSITQADTYTTLILIAFSMNLLLFFTFYKSILHFTNKFINQSFIKKSSAIVISFLETLIIVTFSLYIMMQLKISKVYLKPILKNSYSYSKIQKFYSSFLSDDFVKMVMNSDTGTNHKEVIFKSLKNAL